MVVGVMRQGLFWFTCDGGGTWHQSLTLLLVLTNGPQKERWGGWTRWWRIVYLTPGFWGCSTQAHDICGRYWQASGVHPECEVGGCGGSHGGQCGRVRSGQEVSVWEVMIENNDMHERRVIRLYFVQPPPPTMINQCTPPAMLTSLQKLLVVSPCSPLISSSFLSQARPDLVMEESIIPLSRSPPPCQTGSSPSPASHKLDFVQTISGNSYPCRAMSCCRWGSTRTRSRKTQWCIPDLSALSSNDQVLVVFQLLAVEHHPGLKLCYLPPLPVCAALPHPAALGDLGEKTNIREKHACLHKALLNLDSENPTTKVSIRIVLGHSDDL